MPEPDKQENTAEGRNRGCAIRKERGRDDGTKQHIECKTELMHAIPLQGNPSKMSELGSISMSGERRRECDSSHIQNVKSNAWPGKIKDAKQRADTAPQPLFIP